MACRVAGARRGATEELALGTGGDDVATDVLITEGAGLGVLHQTVEVKYSASYPNLASRYTFYNEGCPAFALALQPSI